MADAFMPDPADLAAWNSGIARARHAYRQEHNPMTEGPPTAEQFGAVLAEMFDELNPIETEPETEIPTDHGVAAADLMAAIEADTHRETR